MLMRLLDEQYMRTPFYGVIKMTDWLDKNGHAVNLKRVRRLLRLMGLEAIYAKPRLSLPQLRDIAFTPICCEVWRSRSRTRAGRPTSRTFA
jgi:putative transposase